MSAESPLNLTHLEERKDVLMKDLKTVVGDADSLLKEVGNATAEEFSAARASIEAYVGDARSKLHEARMAVSGKASCAANAAHLYVNANPWKSLGAAAAAGVLLGMLCRRR
ncbi:MAG: DUF883 domain-containing protein [Uliginosibacterium sp.]|jgi:ElaB/YqjD/DUF883 family membrane-anchored ribosome-binding protein|nr:DUF883 domain-containing protein [Uliginosibacterium sp.]